MINLIIIRRGDLIQGDVRELPPSSTLGEAYVDCSRLMLTIKGDLRSGALGNPKFDGRY